MTKHLVVVAGNIGAGKTSLTERIGARLGWWTGYESVSDNPYLPDFYGDMRTWSFHLQIFFLGHRAEQYLEAARDSRSAILDRSIYEDAYIFARALHHMGNLSERDYLAYRRLFEEKYQNVTIIPYDEFPTVYVGGDPATQKRIAREVAMLAKQKGCDAIITGNGG